MRTHCIFNGCRCRHFTGPPGARCHHCRHGACWHQNNNQFESNRMPARTGYYMFIPIVIGRPEPRVPEIPWDHSRMARSVKKLPV